MLVFKLVVAWLVVSAVFVVLQYCGVSMHEHEDGLPETDDQGCRYCPSSGVCHSALPAPAGRTNQENRS